MNVLNTFKKLAYRPGFIIGLAFLLVIVMVTTKPKEQPEPRRERAWAVDVIQASPKNLSPTLELYGRVQSPQDSQLSAAIEAVVMQMPVRDGAAVSAGTTLLVLDDRDARLDLQQTEADLKEAKAQLAFAKIRLDRSQQAYLKEQELLKINDARTGRAEEIFADGLLSQADMETTMENQARQQLAVNQAELSVEENKARLIELDARINRFSALRDRAMLDLDRTVIKAPFDGIISDLEVSEGDRVRPGDTLMRLQNPASVEVRAQIPSRFAPDISAAVTAGTPLTARIQSGDLNIKGRVLRISGQTRTGSGGVDSFIGIDQPGGDFRLGGTVRILLDLPRQENLIAVPAEAVYGRDRIYKLVDQRMQMVQIERAGERELPDGSSEVLIRNPDLNRTDQIIVTKLANAANGLLVNSDKADSGSSLTRTADNGPHSEPGVKPQ
ncbi:MAG: efflux RND transporter periplasmic adaptor subunit [Gammaproteobacteria bacterium]